jgi:hypothetical protein
MAKLCLTLLCPPSIEEKLLDLLLEIGPDDVFTSAAASSHGLATSRLAAIEQVLGRSASVQIQVLVDETGLEALLSRLREEFRGTGLRYWASVLSHEGEIE